MYKRLYLNQYKKDKKENDKVFSDKESQKLKMRYVRFWDEKIKY